VYLFEDFTESGCFKTMLHDHAMDDFITDINGYAHQVISKYAKGDTLWSEKLDKYN
jgi:hypothetical protein